MNAELSQEQTEFYRENGFIVIDDFLTPEELEVWRDAVDEAVKARGKWKAGDEYFDRVFVLRQNLW